MIWGKGEAMMNKVPKFHAIVGTMRSGTTLLGHLLAEVGWVRYAGESHVEYDGPDSMRKAWEVIGPELPEEEKGAPGKPFCDKVVVPAQMPEGGRVLIAEAEEIYLLLRHPLAVWRSLKSLEWEWARWEYVTKQLRAMKDLVEGCPEGKLRVISYDQLTSAVKRRALFGREMNRYGILPKTGVENWGDPEKLIRSGEIRELSLQEDYERAFREVGGALEDPGFQKAMKIYRELVRLVGREDLLEVSPPVRENEGRELAEKYAGLKEWGWYFGLEEWKSLFYTQKRVRALEIGAFDGVSANMMLDHLFVHPESEVICIDPFLPDPTTPQVCEQTKKDFYENRRRGGHEGRIEIFEGLSVEVLAWMISEEGYWDSFDFIYIDGSHLAKDVLTDAVMSWNLLKYGGVIAFDDYEWNGGSGKLGRPKAGINAFASVFGPELKLVGGGYRRIWQKGGCHEN
jgi:predicted O-methyltransferase YrrM